LKSQLKVVFKTIPAFVLLLFAACTNEDQRETNTESITAQLQGELKLNQFAGKKYSENLEVNWQTLNTVKLDSTEIYEFDIDQKDTIKLESKLFREQLKYKLIALKSNNKMHSYLVEYFSNLSSKYPNSVSELENFTGTLNVFELNGQFLGQLTVLKGKAQAAKNEALLENLKNTINQFYKPNTAAKVPPCIETYTAALIVTEYQDVYQIVSLESTGVVLSIKYLYTKEIRTYVSEFAVTGYCGTNVDPIHQVERKATYNRVFLEEHIEYSDLDPCSKEVLQQLMYGQTSKIMQIFEKFGVDFSRYNVIFESEVPKDPVPASTISLAKFNYKIQINPNYSGTTKLFKAANILHEMVHAHFLSLADNYGSTSLINNPNVFADYPTLYKLFIDKNYKGETFDAHHEEIANSYVDAISTALQEYNKYADPNNVIPYQTYKDIVWGGLRGTPIYEARIKKGSDERLRIENRYASEQTNGPVGYTSGQLQNPIGKPCK